VQRAAIERVGMAHQGGVGGLWGANIEQCFQAAGKTVKND